MNIILVDDDKLITMSLQMLLEADLDIHVLGTANNAEDAIALYEKHIDEVDIAMLDIRMEPTNGIDTAKSILELKSDAKILFLTTFLDDEYIIDALSLGAKGYIIKQDYDTIIPALKAILSGQNVYGNEIVSKIPTLMNTNQNVNGISSSEDNTSLVNSNNGISLSNAYAEKDISEKEAQMIEQIANGLSNKEIAETLFLSEGTVRNYLSTILDKLQLRDRTQLAIFYYKHK